METVDRQNLRSDLVFKPDRFAIQLRIRGTGMLSDAFGAATCFLPAYSISRLPSDSDRQKACLVWLEAHLVSQGLSLFCKGVIRRPRPYAYSPFIFNTDKNDFKSFFSGHTTAAFTNAVLAGLWADDGLGRTGQAKRLWAGGLTLAAATGVLRILSGNHFPTDVLAGAAVGCLAADLLYRLHH